MCDLLLRASRAQRTYSPTLVTTRPRPHLAACARRAGATRDEARAPNAGLSPRASWRRRALVLPEQEHHGERDGEEQDEERVPLGQRVE